MNPPCPDRVNVLLLGTGGREHAIAWKLRQSPRLGELWVEPGANAGLLALGRPCPEPISMKEAFRLNRWCDRERIGLVVIGPEAPLAAGFADVLAEGDRKVFGPSKEASRLEWDKAWAKQMMRTASVPTAEGRAFTNLDAAIAYAEVREEPCVVKAAGLAAGKGVVLCDTAEEAVEAVRDAMERRVFGDAGDAVVVEEKLEGPELSVMALVDGRTIWVLDACRDHKRVGEGDTGLNTGGMGAYSPAPVLTPALEKVVMETIVQPTVDGMAAEGCPFTGVIFAGLMIADGEVKLLEHNVRFGDPECQCLMARMRGDLVDLLLRAANGTLGDAPEMAWSDDVAAVVVVAAEGYPGAYKKGETIGGLDAANAKEGVKVIHAGTALDEKTGDVVSAGGRVLGVVGTGASVKEATARAYAGVDAVEWKGGFCRRDIGWRAIEREEGK